MFQTSSLYKSTIFKKEEEVETVGLHIIFVTRKTLTRKWLHMGIEVENQIMYLHLLILQIFIIKETLPVFNM